MTKPITLLLIAAFFKELFFSAVVPVWHTPDEQAHFAQVAFFAETKLMPSGPIRELNREIYQSEKLLGTLRDKSGNNQFTFHPEYRIDYTDSLEGKYEKEIKNLPHSSRLEMVGYEAARYPPLYYWLSSAAYNLFYNSDLISRVFAVRFFSVILSVGTVYISWLIGRKVFKGPFYQLILPLMVVFHPQLSFVSAGVNSDNLFNLFFTLIIYCGVLIISEGFQRKNIYITIFAFFGAFLTKPQFVLGIPMIITAVLLRVYIKSKVSPGKKILVTVSGFLILLSTFYILAVTDLFNNLQQVFYPQVFNAGLINNKNNISFVAFFKNTIAHTVAEVMPWYWGVFNWLGVVLPRDVNRVINRIILVAAVGLGVRLIQIIKNRRKEDYFVFYMLCCSLIYFMGITFFNYLYTLSHGFPFGIQGRYYFPTISSHMFLLIIGICSLIPVKFFRLKTLSLNLLAFWMITLNFIALWVIINSYYSTKNLEIFINQVSQYKPDIFKGPLFLIWFTVYIASLLVFLIKLRLVKVKPNEF